jgi:hypothetical protein
MAIGAPRFLADFTGSLRLKPMQPGVAGTKPELALDFRADAGAARFVVRQTGQRHEADSLVAILFE